MNRLYKKSRLFVAFFYFLYCTSFGSDWSNCHQMKFSVFTHEDKRDSGNSRIHSDFSHDDTWNTCNGRGVSSNTNDFDSYTKENFEYLRECGYTEAELLNQRCLYMNNEFVQYAQTCSGYKNAVQKLYAELKNINLIQKIYRAAQGKYCKGLQDRIAYLYKQLNAVKAVSQDSDHHNTVALNKPVASTKVANFDAQVLAEQYAEYKALESLYDSYTPSLAKAINARSTIYSNIVDRDFALERVNKSYDVNSNVKKLLSRRGHELAPFIYCSGNQLQQVIHQESLNILDRVDSLSARSVLYDHQEALVDLTAAMVDYNHAGMIDKAMTIGDLCWTLLDYGQAIVEGAALGVYSAARDVLTNPIEVTVSIVAGKQILVFQLCKVLYNVADIGVTAIHNIDGAKEKWNKYAEPLNNVINAINKKEITVRDAIKSGTTFVVGYKAQGKLLGGLSKFCTTIKHKSISFVKNNSLLNPQEYLTTPEGSLFKATVKSNKIKSCGKTRSASNLKKVVDDKVLKAAALPAASTVEKGIIRNDLRSVIQQYKEHIFSKKHVKNGLMAAGESQEKIMDLLNDVIMSLDKKGLLKEGANQIKATINGIKNVEIKCFVENGRARSVDAYISDFNRLYNNFIDATKV